MSSPASIKNHPIHPMLIALPMGLWIFALVCDIVRVSGGAPAWSTVALYSVGGGIVGALLAAVPGFIDYLSINETAMNRIALIHMVLNLGAIVVFGLNLWSRLHLADDSRIPLSLSVVGVLMIGLGGWLGGEMVYVKGMAVGAKEEPTKKENKRPRLRNAG